MKVFILCLVIGNCLLVLFLFKSILLPLPTNQIALAAGRGQKMAAGEASQEFINQLESRGLDPVLIGSIKRSSFSATGTLLALTGDNVQIFEYKDKTLITSELDQAMRQYSATGASRRWRGYVYIYQKNNLIVYYMGGQLLIVKTLNEILGQPLVSPR